jgi:MOSC domain-containing protein YiiM
MVELKQAAISCASGVEDDFRGKPGKRQVTVLAREAWERACADLDAGIELPWTMRRANLLVEGIDLEQTAGQRIRIGDVTLEITCETDPCFVMDRQHPGLREALVPNWRGGASCRVIGDGVVALGDEATLEPPS